MCREPKVEQEKEDREKWNKYQGMRNETSSLGGQVSVTTSEFSASWAWIRALVKNTDTFNKVPARNLSCFVTTNAMDGSHGRSLRVSMPFGSVILKVWAWLVSSYLLCFILWGKILSGNFSLVLEWYSLWLRWISTQQPHAKSQTKATHFHLGFSMRLPRAGELSWRAALLSGYIKDILISMSFLCCPSHLETPAGPGRAGMEGHSRLEWGSLPSGWIISDSSNWVQLGFITGSSDPSWRVPVLKQFPSLLNRLGCPASLIRRD